MNVLVLGSSNDTGDFSGDAPKRHELVRDRLAAEFGEPVVVVAKNLWPNERMSSLVDRWIAELRPDLVYMNVTTFPFSYESLPLRLERMLGPLGKHVSHASFQLADSKRWAHNAVFRTLRRWGQATIGGDTHFTPETVVERLTETIRVVVRNEETILIVKGPHGRGEPALTRRARRRREAKRLYVHSALASVCEQLHVAYVGRESPQWQELNLRQSGLVVGDGVHVNAAGHIHFADELFVALRDAWSERSREETAVAGGVRAV